MAKQMLSIMDAQDKLSELNSMIDTIWSAAVHVAQDTGHCSANGIAVSCTMLQNELEAVSEVLSNHR